MTEFWRRFLFLLRRSRIDRELEEEMRAHLEMKSADQIEAGATPEQARRRAYIEFGNPAVLQERSRDAWGWGWLESLGQDLRYGLRMLRKGPGFTAVAVLSLALGIGANTAIFSLIDATLLRMLPVQRPEELVLLDLPDQRGNSLGFSYPLFEALRDHNQTLAGIFAFDRGAMNVSVDGRAELAPGGGQYVSGSYFSTLGVLAVVGRTFTAEEDKIPGEHPIAVISYQYWQRRFARDASVAGKTIYLNGHPFTVIGVTPPRFFGVSIGRSPDVTIPMMMYPQLNPGNTQLTNKGSWWLMAMARLKPGVTASQATADLNVALQQYLTENAPSIRVGSGMKMAAAQGAWGDSPRGKAEARLGMAIMMALVGMYC